MQTLTRLMQASSAVDGGGISGISPSVIKEVGDLGIMLVISTVIVVFITKVLTTLLEQNKVTVSSILPKISEVADSIASAKRDITEMISSHNLSSNKQFFESQTRLAAMDAKLDAAIEKLNELEDALQEIEVVVKTTSKHNIEHDTKDKTKNNN